MRNPLNKRLPRMLVRDIKKYLVLFLLLSVTIGAVSGIFVANGSMETAAKEAFEKYDIEDGHFELKERAAEGLLAAFEERGIDIYEQFCKELSEDKDGDGIEDAQMRIFVMREEINRACLMEGEFPESADEIVIDRMHAANNGIACGDSIRLGGKEMTVCGLVAFSDYSTLFRKNTDTMFDAITFGLGAVTAEAFEELEGKKTWQYAFSYREQPADVMEQKKKADKLMEQIAVLSASGGVMDDADLAKEKKDELEARGDALEAEGDSLEAEGDALKERGDRLEAEGDALKAEADALQAEGEALEAEANALAEDGNAVFGKVGELFAMLGIPVPSEAVDAAQTIGDTLPPELLALLPADIAASITELQEKKADLEKRGKELEEKGAELEERGEELQERVDALQAEADALQEKADDLQERADALEAEADALVNKELENELTDYVPEYSNQAIHFAVKDFGADKAMMEVLLVILVVVLAFIFAITQSNTIVNEAAVIGTLRSSGYTRGEMAVHYLALPCLVTLLAAIAGNLLGYTCLKNVVVSMYYNSYSLPAYETRWNADSFIRTTLVPCLIMIVINIAVILSKITISPLKFLRRDLSRSRRKRALRLPDLPFLHRFRIRIFQQNLAGYAVLFLGIFFVMVLLTFSVGMPVTLHDYQDHVGEYIVAPYQYILMGMEDEDENPVRTAEPSAEAYSVRFLKTVDGAHVGEDITVYGYREDSRYFHLPQQLPDDQVWVSQSYAEKFSLKKGQEIVLREEFEETTYSFVIGGFYDMPGTMAVFLREADFNRIFDLEEGSFSAYLSREEIHDIDEDMIAAVITEEDSVAMVKQLDHSIGAYMTYFSVVCIFIAMLIIYLLTKLIIEQNAGNISMVKVLGYRNGEIYGLYVVLTSIVVVVSSVLTAFLSLAAVKELWKSVMARMSGYFSFYMRPQDILQIILMVFVAYVVVAFADMRRIRRIKLSDALKNVE